MNAPATNFNIAITSLFTENQTLYATIDPLLDDADGVGIIRYQWQRSDGSGGWINIIGATSTFYALSDADVGYQIRVQVYFVDGGGTTETAYSAPSQTILNVNDVPMGAPLISGSLVEGNTISADISTIADADGLPDSSTFIYQWQRSTNGGETWSNIAGETAESYTLSDADSSNKVRLALTYVDLQGTSETIYSATGSVTNVNVLITAES